MPEFAYFCGTDPSLGRRCVRGALRVGDRPLVETVADIVTIQVTSVDQSATIGRVGEEVLPALRRLASPA